MPSTGEWMVLLVVGLLIFGRRLPEVGRSFARTLTQFRRGLQDFKREMDKDEDLKDVKKTLSDVKKAVDAPRIMANPGKFLDSSVGAILALPASMAADAVDIDSARTGEQRAGLYFSVWGMLKKGAAAAGGALGIAAAAAFGFDPTLDFTLGGTPEGNSESSLLWVAVLYSIIPAGIKFIALPFIWKYPLTEERQRRIRERIERRGVVLDST